MSRARAKVSGSVLLGVVLIAGLVIAMPAAAAGNPSATGGGTAQELGETSTFTFNAIQHHDGTVNGHLVYHVRAFNISFDMDIDCLQLTVWRPEEALTDEAVVLGDFDMMALFAKAFEAEGVPESFREKVIEQYHRHRMVN